MRNKSKSGKRFWFSHYTTAVLSVAAALGATLILKSLLQETPAALFYVAVMVSSWIGGFSSGLLATILSTIAVNYFLADGHHSFIAVDLKTWFQLGIFAMAALLISYLNESRLRAKQRADVNLKSWQDSETRYRYLANSIPQLVWMAAPDGTMLDVNDRWSEYTGLTLEQVRSQGWESIVHPEDIPVLSQHWIAAVQAGTDYQAEGRQRRADGVYRWHLHQAVPQKNDQGQIVKWYGTATDIHDRKQAEEERQQVQAELSRSLSAEQIAREEAERANRIKDEFLAVLSHELRSPLNPILGWTKLLQSRPFTPEKTAQALATIERNAKLQAQLIEDLLDVSRILRGKMVLNVGLVDLVTTIEAAIDTVRLAAEAKNIDLRFAVNGAVVRGEESVIPAIQVSGDAARLQQIVWNLLSNAVKFTPPEGRVEVRLESFAASGLSSQLEAPTQHSNLKPQTSYARITVTDTGKGINPDFLPYVFDYFRQEDGATTRKFGGLGLGLAIVKQGVELHGGTVSVDSPGEGQGATFTIRLPLIEQRQAGSRDGEISLDVSESTPCTPLTHLRILVVDDEADMRDLLLTILQNQGAQVEVAASAAAALVILEQWQPDLLISDIGMPNMDGYMLIRQVRSRPPEQGGLIPAIALTAYAAEIDQQQALAAGFQRHLAKPIEPVQLIQGIVNLLNSKSKSMSIRF